MDGIVGLIPVLGHIFDVFYKANRRNLVLAVEHFEGGQHQGSAWAEFFLYSGVILGFNILYFLQ